MTKKTSKPPLTGSVPKLALGASLLILGLILFLGRHRVDGVLSQSFETEPVIISEFSKEAINEAQLPRRVIIPELFIDLEVKKASIANGYWEVFTDSAGWGEGSGLPGLPGNQVIFAHAREGLFLPLRSIEVGFRIYILSEEKWYEYEVKEIKEVYPNQTEVIAPSEDETLTLYTCSGFADSKRLIVVAERI